MLAINRSTSPGSVAKDITKRPMISPSRKALSEASERSGQA